MADRGLWSEEETDASSRHPCNTVVQGKPPGVGRSEGGGTGLRGVSRLRGSVDDGLSRGRGAFPGDPPRGATGAEGANPYPAGGAGSCGGPGRAGGAGEGREWTASTTSSQGRRRAAGTAW